MLRRTESSALPTHSPLPGRAAEVVRLETQFAEGRDSRSWRVVFVRGPAGVGRSTLVAEAARRLAQAGVPVLTASAPRLSPVAYGLVRPLVDQCLARVRPTSAPSALRAREEQLGPVFGRPAVRGASPLDLCASVADLVAGVARDEAAAIVLDDVDAADPSSLAVLSYLVAALTAPGATRGPDEPLAGGLLLLSLRDDALPQPLADLLARTGGLSLPLGALDLEGVRHYLARSGAAERLFEASGGVPGVLEELLAPSGAIDLAARRLERLAPADREVLVALALVAQPVEASFAAAVSGRRDAAQRLARLETAALVAATPGAGRTLFGIAREGDRRALLQSLSPSALAELRAAAGEQLLSRGEREQAFEQILLAGDAPRAVALGLEVAEALAARLALDHAGHVLGRLTDLDAGDELRARTLLALAGVLERQGHARAAAAALGRARSLLPATGHRAVRARIARLCLSLGAPRPAERLARAVLASGQSDHPALEARVALADARFLRGAYDDALAAAHAASDTPAPHRFLLGNTRGKALLTLGRLDEARRTFAENALDAEQAGDASERTRALLNVGVVAHRQGDRDEARAAYRRALADGAGPFAAIVHANLSSLLLEEGEAEEALRQAHRALAEFARTGRQKEQAHAAQNLARIYLYIGDMARADELALHSAQLAERVGDPYLGAGARLVRAEVLHARTDEGAPSALEDAADAFQALKNPRYLRESLLALAAARLSRNEDALAVAALERAKSEGALGHPATAADAWLVEAELALRARQLDAAGEALSEARGALLAEPQLELPARLYLLQGALAEAHGERAHAQAERLKAARILDELAARIPPDRRPLFFARPRRRAILDAAGRLFFEAPRTAPAARPEPSVRPALIGASPAILRVNALVERIGPSVATVLVRGESGTGKELVAKALHDASPRRDLPLVAVNCGALNEELLLSELFGHEKGSFTGAVKERKGRFELADGGTIFLDEIGDISPRAQVALLRVLQERTFERVGGTKTVRVDVRVVCATNRNLEELMRTGEFREDLYYRLRGASLQLPPLRERTEDLPRLCEHLLARLASERGEPVRAITAEALRMLERHAWPGNVRELQNVLESATLLSPTPALGPEAFELFPELFGPRRPVARPSSAAAPPAVVIPVAAPAPAAPAAPAPAGGQGFYASMKARAISLRDLRRELELECIAAALVEGGGLISEAGRLLGMKRSRLSQIVNAEPTLRVLCKGSTEPDTGDAGEGDDADEGGAGVALSGRRKPGRE